LRLCRLATNKRLPATTHPINRTIVGRTKAIAPGFENGPDFGRRKMPGFRGFGKHGVFHTLSDGELLMV